MLSVQTNILALNANRQLGLTTKGNAKTSEKLSSGYRINRAADDAAGLSISEKMRRQIRGLTQAAANAQDGISLVQIGEGALNEVHDMLQRANELSVKAATGTLQDADRAMIDAEIQQLKSEIDKTAQNTTFNEINIFPEDGLQPEAGFSEVYEFDLTYNLADGSVTINGMSDNVSGADAAMSRAAVNPTASGGALATKLATDFIPEAATKIFDAFPSLKNEIGSETLNIKITVKSLDGKGQMLARAGYSYYPSGSPTKRGFNLEIQFDSNDFKMADAEGTGSMSKELQSTVAHELMHSVMQYVIPIKMKKELPEWFTEGVAQLSGGGFPTNWNNTLIAYAKLLTDENDASQDAGIKNYLKKYTPAKRPYGHGYLAAAYAGWLANGGGAVTSANIAAGMDKILGELIKGSSFTSAIQKCTGVSASTITSSITNGSGDALEFVRKLSYNSLGGAGSVITSTLGVAGVIDGSGGGGGPVTPVDPSDPSNQPIGVAGENKLLELQVGAEPGQHIAVPLYQMSTDALGLSATNVKTTDDADLAIDEIKAAIHMVSNVRSEYGAIQNRLEHTINNLKNIAENTAAAESRIRDADIAEEMVDYSNNQILMQAGASMLSQANQQSERILTLLG